MDFGLGASPHQSSPEWHRWASHVRCEQAMSPPISRIWMSVSPRGQSHRQQQRCRHRPWSQPYTKARSFDQRARQSRVRGQTIRTPRMQVLQVREPHLPHCMAASSGRRPGDSAESLLTRSLHPWEKCRAVPGSPRSTAPLPSGQRIGRARRQSKVLALTSMCSRCTGRTLASSPYETSERSLSTRCVPHLQWKRVAMHAGPH